MHVRCPTGQAVLLFGVKGEGPAYRFVGGEASPPGLLFTPTPGLPLIEPLVASVVCALQELGQAMEPAAVARALAWRHDYQDCVVVAGEPATLYLATLDLPSCVLPPSWRVLPDILRTLPRDRSRLPYLRAFQVLSGGLEVQTKALEVDDVDKYFN